ncbi:type IV pilus twitching motility protein PilT [Klebsiella pneumoniae]|nr:type IV pilus twitching motility protein PilT [Klebsiella pneumoniae]
MRYTSLVNTPAVANLIREGKVHQLPGVMMQTGDAGRNVDLYPEFS